MRYLILCLFLSSCVKSQEEYIKQDKQAALRHLNHLIYIQDRSTHLCYAFFDPNYHWGTMTTVNCTDEVLKKAVKN